MVDRYEGQEEDEETAAANAASSTSAGKNNELTVDAGRLDTDASSKSSTLERSKLKLDLATGRLIVELYSRLLRKQSHSLVIKKLLGYNLLSDYCVKAFNRIRAMVLASFRVLCRFLLHRPWWASCC